MRIRSSSFETRERNYDLRSSRVAAKRALRHRSFRQKDCPVIDSIGLAFIDDSVLTKCKMIGLVVCLYMGYDVQITNGIHERKLRFYLM